MIKRIIIDKFKSIEHLVIEPAGNFNVLIGENNIGKTTIFEAIHLWKMCYDLNIKKDKTGFYSFAKNMKFEDMEFIRVYHDEDLFPIGAKGKDAKCSITLEIEYRVRVFTLGFSISKVSNIDDAYLQIDYINSSEFKEFAEMVSQIQGKNLSTFLAINESKPIPNIIAKEPYMYKAQILDKIAKGKGYEVLRNKVINHISEVQTHVNNVMDSNYKLSEIDKENRTYISIRVDGKDIFSYGSGFLQLTEIFSSMEYLDPEIYILLIDEPDAHLHLKLQRKLINEFRNIGNSQLFIITHNERFLEQVEESEILFVDEQSKQSGLLNRLPDGCKQIALENLKGCLEQLDKFQYSTKIVMLEGKTDIDFIDALKPKYEQYTGKVEPPVVYIQMVGIDTLNAKLITYSRALKGIISENCKWIVIRDTDCVPCNKKVEASNEDKKNVDVQDIKIVFQDGYGIESTFAAEPEKLARMFISYYGLPVTDVTIIQQQIEAIASDYEIMVKDITNKEVHKELEKHFNRQKEKRASKLYQKLEFSDMLSQISNNNIQYALTKKIMDSYLTSIHKRIASTYGVLSKDALNINTIFTYYYSWISSIDDFFLSHKQLLDEIYS